MLNEKYQKGLVSVIIPTYKRCDMLLRAINSVLNQSYSYIELIVVNDNIPNDEFSRNLYGCLENIRDNRFVFLEQDEHINGARARNVGISYAHGEYIAFLDDDDTWEIDKIKIQVEAMSKLDSSWGMVSSLKKFYVNGNCYRASRSYKDGSIFYDVLCGVTNITTGTVLIRHSVLDEVGVFDENLKRHQDLQLFALITNKYKVKLIPAHLLNSDVSDNQNRPAINDLIAVKEAYFNSISSLIKIDKKTLKHLKKHLQFSIGIRKLKEKKIWLGLKDVFSTIISPKVFFKEVNKYVIALFEVKFMNYYIRKYSLE